MGVLDYSSTAGSNTSVGGIAITGNSNVQNFDNALRQIMADIAAGIAAGSFSGMGYATKSSGYTIVAADRGKIIDCTTTLELELTAAATLGAGFYVIIKANGGDVTIDPNGTENINGASSSLVLLNGQQAVIACTGSAWHSVLVTAPAASATVAGLVELATDAETQTGTDTARAITPANLSARAATQSVSGIAELATAAEVRDGTAGKIIDPAILATAGAIVSLTDAATVAVDWNTFINADVTITANRALGNPTNVQVGTFRTITVKGSSSTDRTMTFGSNYEGDIPTLTDIDDGKWYLLTLFALTATHIVLTSVTALKP